MEKILWFIGSFIFVYLIYLITVIFKIKKNDKFKKSNQVLYFKRVYKIDIDKLNLTKFAHIIALTNAFMIALVATLIDFFDKLIVKMLVGFVILVPLMLLLYHIIGKIIKSKEK